MAGTTSLHDGSEPTDYSHYAADFKMAVDDSNLDSKPSESKPAPENANPFASRPAHPPRLAENEAQMAQHPFYRQRLHLGNELASPTIHATQPMDRGIEKRKPKQEYHGRISRSHQAYYRNRSSREWRESPYARLLQQQVNNAHSQGSFYHNRIAHHTPPSADGQFQGGYHHHEIPADAQTQPSTQYVDSSSLPAPAPVYTNPIASDQMSIGEQQPLNMEAQRTYYNARTSDPILDMQRTNYNTRTLDPISMPAAQSLNADMQRTYYNARTPDPIFMAGVQSSNADMQRTYYNARAPDLISTPEQSDRVNTQRTYYNARVPQR